MGTSNSLRSQRPTSPRLLSSRPAYQINLNEFPTLPGRLIAPPRAPLPPPPPPSASEDQAEPAPVVPLASRSAQVLEGRPSYKDIVEPPTFTPSIQRPSQGAPPRVSPPTRNGPVHRSTECHRLKLFPRFLRSSASVPNISLSSLSPEIDAACTNVLDRPVLVETESMATSSMGASPGGRQAISPRPMNRGGRSNENARNTVCRNIKIYGHCRYQNDTCLYLHPPDQATSGKSTLGQSSANSAHLNVDSPSFKPLQPSQNGLSTPRSTISPKSASAAPFTPKTNAATLQPPTTFTAPAQQNFQTPHFQEFVPQQSYESGQVLPHADQYGGAATYANLDSYALTSAMGMASAQAQPQINPYAHDPAALANAYYQNASTFAQPVQYHNYFPLAPHRENLEPYQKTAHDFFIPDDLREDLQKKAEASWQTLPNSTLPTTVEHYHSLVPLDTTNTRNNTIFGYVTWLYKAMSTKDGKCYTLRRLEGYRLTNEQAIRTFYPWKEINNGSVVKIHEAFTTRDFGDSSLIFVTDYHPNSKTLAELYIPTAKRYAQHIPQLIPEAAMWGWVVQFACALKAVHSAGLAVRALHPSKVLLTSKNRIRINGHAVLDVVKFDAAIPLDEQQQDDFVQLGHLVVSIATNTNATTNIPKARELMTRYYTPKMKELVDWLLRAPNMNLNPPEEKTVDTLLAGLTDEMVSTFGSQLHAEDTITSTLMAELENGRLVRLMAKLGLINERPEFDHNTRWSETGERYQLRLFRDYVFHAVDAQGNPVTNLGHIITCLNKLDAGSLETIQLVSRDEQHQYVVSYKDLKKGIETSFNELSRGRSH